MDGNRRYGRERFSDPVKGHGEGGRALSNVSQWCLEKGIKHLTVYAFSTENWRRDPSEISALMHLFTDYAHRMKKEALNSNIQIRVLSTDTSRLPPHVQAAMTDLESSTTSCTSLILNLCVSYGSRGEIAHACQQLARNVAAGTLHPDQIDEAAISRSLLTSHSPDPDLLLRTSGECRLSNFLLFQLAYAEMVFLDKYWPEVTARDLDGILHEYIKRERRFGC
ncbi:di-cis-decaprenylcistransferase [Nannochloropsis oceanica]